MHAYCLFCQTQRCEEIAEAIRSITGYQCLVPRIVQRYWKKGQEEHRIHPYLPGYLFLYTEDPIDDFRNIRSITGVLRVLGLPENGYQLTGSDRAFADMLHQMDGTLGILKTCTVGDRVQIDASLYQGFCGEITRLDRRKGRAQIRFDFDGQIQNVWVGVDLVKRQDKD